MAMTSWSNKLLKICSKIMLQGSTDCHNSSKQLPSELFLTSQCYHTGEEDSTLGSHTPFYWVYMLLYTKDLALCGVLNMMCLKSSSYSCFSSSYFTVVRPIQLTIDVNSPSSQSGASMMGKCLWYCSQNLGGERFLEMTQKSFTFASIQLQLPFVCTRRDTTLVIWSSPQKSWSCCV